MYVRLSIIINLIPFSTHFTLKNIVTSWNPSYSSVAVRIYVRPVHRWTVQTISYLSSSLLPLIVAYGFIFFHCSTRSHWKSYIRKVVLRSFKVIQGHQNWYQSKAHMRRPISLLYCIYTWYAYHL